MEKTDEQLAEEIHNAYEKYSKNAGWKTQKITQVKFKDLPEENKVVMISIGRLINEWIKEAKRDYLKELRTHQKVTLYRYDDAYDYDLQEDYFAI